MKSCPEFREAIALHATKALEPERRSALTRHLESCSDCRARFEEMEALTRAVGSTLSSNGVVRPPRPAAAPLPALSLLSMTRAWNESDATLDQLLAREEKILLAGDPPLRAWNTATDFTRQ